MNTIKCSGCDTPITTIDHIISLCAGYFWCEPTDWQLEKLREHVYNRFEKSETVRTTELPTIQKRPESET